MTVALISKEGTPAGPVFDYFPYGKQKEEVVTPEKITQTFTGKEFDLFEQDTTSGDDGEGWYYFGARYYDSDIGRWISCDPAKEFWDLYRYTTNPINFLDPNGLTDIWVALYNSDYSSKAVQDLNKNVKPKEGDKVVFKKFTPGQENAMYKFLNQKGESLLDAHGNNLDKAVFFTSAAAMLGSKNGR